MSYSSSTRFKELLREIEELHDRKQADYGTVEDPFANVRATAFDWGIEPWVGAMIRATDKIRRLMSMLRNRRLENESAEDSLKDLAVYALIALILFEEHERAKTFKPEEKV